MQKSEHDTVLCSIKYGYPIKKRNLLVISFCKKTEKKKEKEKKRSHKA